MKITRATIVALLAGLLVVSPAAAQAPTWHSAQAVTLPSGGVTIASGFLPSLACPSAGNCVAAGEYADASATSYGLILNEANGVWKSPTTIVAPAGAAAASVLTPYGVACASAGNCAVVGDYLDTTNNSQSFVVNEVNGVWKSAQNVPLPSGAATTNLLSQLRGVSCPSVGNCSAVGTYTTSANKILPVAVNEVNGVWRHAVTIGLPANANFNPFTTFYQVSCTSAGNCAAAGSYVDSENVTHALVATEVNGVWGAGLAVALPANASAFATASLSSLTCVSDGECSALGTYISAAGNTEALVARERAGVWQRASELAMPANAAANPHAFLYGYTGIACPSATDCVAGGQYRDASGNYQGFLADEVHGVWRVAQELKIPSGAVQAGKNGGVVSVSCSSAGNCSAGAAYVDAGGNYQALLASETGGAWSQSTSLVLPGGATTVGVAGGVYAVVCAKSGVCNAVGSYLAPSSNYEGFTVSSN